MDLSEYMSGVRPLVGDILVIQKSRHELDEVTEYFFLLMVGGYASAYHLWRFIQKEKHPNWIKPIAYKNVLKRVHKLFKLGLIEEVKREGGYKHGARRYKVSTLGFIYRCSQNLGLSSDFIKSYSDSFVMRTLAHPLFERETLRHSTDYLDSRITSFIQECCSITARELSKVYITQKSHPKFNTKWRLEILEFELNWLIKEFVIRLSLGHGHYKSKDMKEKILEVDYTTINDKKISTFDLISKDKKFMTVLEEVSKEFFRAHNALMELKNQNV